MASDGSPGDLERLCAEVVAGAPGALDRLHARLTPGLIRHFARKLGDRAPAAEELAQQTWIAFWQALSQGKYDPGKSRPTTFLYAVSGNIWLRHLRAVGRARVSQSLNEREVVVGGREGVGLAEGDPAELAAEASAIDLVRRVLGGHEPAAGLSEEERLILRSISQGTTDRELATMLGVAPSTAHARKRVATDKLRQFLTSRGISDGSSEREAGESANK